MSTRPRITFDDSGFYACLWVEKKNSNWNKRQIELEKLLEKFRVKIKF